MTEPAHERDRYQLWTQLCTSANHLQRLAEEWFDLESGVQRAHGERCNLDQLPLFEQGQLHHVKTDTHTPQARDPVPSRPRPPSRPQLRK